MNFSPDGALSKIAYGYTKTCPKQTNLCALFWRTALGMFCVWPLIFLTRLFGWVVRIVGAIPVFVLLGSVPEGSNWRFLEGFSASGGNPFPFRPLKWWPKWRGHRVLPGIILVMLFVGALLAYTILYVLLWQVLIMYFFVGLVLGTTIGVVIFLAVMIAMLVTAIYLIVRQSEIWQLVRGYAKTKKEKVCPLVTFQEVQER